MNDRVGIVLAIGTPDPWGYPGGSILDAGRVVSVPAGATDLKGATFGPDTVLTVQFLFNTWDAWAPANAGIVYCDLVKYNFATKAIDNVNGVPAVQVKRKFAVPYNDGGVSVARDLDVISYYSIPAGEEYAYMFDTVTRTTASRSPRSLPTRSASRTRAATASTPRPSRALCAANTYNWVEDAAGEPDAAVLDDADLARREPGLRRQDSIPSRASTAPGGTGNSRSPTSRLRRRTRAVSTSPT